MPSLDCLNRSLGGVTIKFRAPPAHEWATGTNLNLEIMETVQNTTARELPQAGQSVWLEIWNAETGEDEGQMLVVEKIESGIIHCAEGTWFAVGLWLAGNGEVVD